MLSDKLFWPDPENWSTRSTTRGHATLQRGIDGIDGMRLIRDDIAAHVNNLAARLTDHPDRPHHKTQPTDKPFPTV